MDEKSRTGGFDQRFLNNRIKVIKRMAYGFRDSEYFFLKIKAAFPGKAR
nr:transposase [Stutzerimonas stutzeri]